MANNDNIKRALNPLRFPTMSTRMMAVIGYIVEARYVEPPIVEMRVDKDGTLFAKVKGDTECNDFMGTIVDFKHSWKTLIHIPNLGLSVDEIKYLEMLPSVMIKNYGE